MAIGWPPTQAKTPMTPKQMLEVVKSLRIGEKLKVVFADGILNDRLRDRVHSLVKMCAPLGTGLQNDDELHDMALGEAADTGEWNGFREHVFTVLEGFAPEYFASCIIAGCGLVESVEKIGR
jgi:hypothetical protein